MLVIGAGRNLICHFYNCYLIALLCEQISCFQAGHAGADHCNLFSFQFYAAIENLCYGADMRLIRTGNTGMNGIPAG